MKTLKYIALATLTLSFAACTQDEDFVPQGNVDAVKINATIGALQTRVSYDDNGNTQFQPDDKIRVISHTRQNKNKNKSDAVYKFNGTLDWEPAQSDKYVVWDGIEANTFYGVYPATVEYTAFTIPTNQSGGVQVADWMTASYTGYKSAGDVTFQFQHLLSKVTVTITKWNNEFEGTEEITEPKIYTNGTDVKADYENGSATITATGVNTDIDPHVNGTSYTAIVAPVEYAITDKFMTFTVAGQDMTVFAKNGTLTGGLQPGKHYSFELAVGKSAVTIESVSVTKWDEEDINGGVVTGNLSSINTTGLSAGDFTLVLWSTADNTKYETHQMTNTDGAEWDAIKSSILPAHAFAYKGSSVTDIAYTEDKWNYTVTLQTDQTDATKLADADVMIATGNATAGTALDLNFAHCFAKVTFNATLESEFDNEDQITIFKVMTADMKTVDAYADGKTVSAIITSGQYMSGKEFLSIEVSGVDKPLTVKVPSVGLYFNAGTHYTFNLKVGKDKVTIETSDDGNPFGNGWNKENELSNGEQEL